MADLADGGRSREAHDTSETMVISVISSNLSPAAALPSPVPAARTATNHGQGFWHLLHSEHLCREKSSDLDSFHSTQDTEQSTPRASAASPPSPQWAAPCAYRRDMKLGLVLMSTMILPVTLNKMLFPLCWGKRAILNFLKCLKPQRQAVLQKMAKHDKYNFRWTYTTILHRWLFVWCPSLMHL